MLLQKQIITLEQAQRLKELLVLQRSIFYWVQNAATLKWELIFSDLPMQRWPNT
jgi:hypothetical protein